MIELSSGHLAAHFVGVSTGLAAVARAALRLHVFLASDEEGVIEERLRAGSLCGILAQAAVDKVLKVSGEASVVGQVWRWLIAQAVQSPQ